jgi:hypothetical protein
MSLQTWGETLISAQVDGTALANTTTATSILPAAAKYTLPANFFAIGRVLRVNMWGRVSNIVTTPGTLTLDVRFGSTVVFNGGAMSLNTTAKTNVTWRAIMMLTCRAIGGGTTANLMGTGDWTSESAVSSAANTANDIMMPASVPAVGTGFDSTASQAVDIFATWSIANAGNSIQLHQYTLEAMN